MEIQLINVFLKFIIFFLLLSLSQSSVSYFTEIEKCKITTHGQEYIGTINKTLTGKKCLPWTEEILKRLNIKTIKFSITFNHNFCRNPNGDPYGPWCIIDDRTLTLEYCNIVSCNKDRNWCKDTRQGTEYTGKINVTDTGKTCKPWTSQSKFQAFNFPENNLEDAGNQCRNPDNYSKGPWCYTVDQKTKWEACDIPECDSEFSQIEYFGRYNFLKTVGRRLLDITSLPNVYKNATFTASIKLSLINFDTEIKSSLWATDYDPACQTDMNEYEYCQLTKSQRTKSHVKLIYTCSRPLKNLIYISPIPKLEYVSEYQLGDVLEIKESPSIQFLKYQEKITTHFNKRNRNNVSIPMSKSHGYFLLLEDNVIPYAVTPSYEVVATISEIGKGRIGFLASETLVEEAFESNVQDFFNVVYESDKVSPIRLTSNVLEQLHSRKKSGHTLSTPVIWNAHQEIGNDNTELLLDLVKNGLRIIIGVKPWAYDYYRRSLSVSELKTLFLAAGIWPSTNSMSESLTVLNHVEMKTFPLVHLLDYAKTSVSNAIYVSDCISRAFLEVPFDNLIDKNKFKSINQNKRILLETYKHHIKSLIPCLDKPLSYKNDKEIVKLINSLLVHPSGNKVTAPGLSFYPGKLLNDKMPNTKTVKMKLNMQFSNEAVQLGLYIPPGEHASVKISGSKSQTCELYVNYHLFNVLNKDEWEKWPITNTKYVLKRDKSKVFSFAFGGLLSLSCKENDDNIYVTFHGVIPTPIFDRRDPESIRSWNQLKRFDSPWAVISSDTAVFVVSSNSIRNLENPNEVMELYDKMIKQELHLRGKSVSECRRELISTDIQIKAGYMHAGYPIGTKIKHVTNPKVPSKYLFDKVNIKQEGRWGLLHEIGHNLQDSIFTFSGTTEVTNNIFTLIGIETMIGKKSWSPSEGWLSEGSYVSRFVSYINDGVFVQWQDDPFIALAVFAQLRAHFDWELYFQVFRQFDILRKKLDNISDNDKIQLWIRETSFVAKMNLCPIYELWRWPIEKTTKKELIHLKSFMPNDFLTRMVKKRVDQIIEKYGGSSVVVREPSKVPKVIGNLPDKDHIEGKKVIEEMNISN